MAQTHSRVVEGRRWCWNVDRLWVLSADLPVQLVAIDTIAELDEDCWFCGKKLPTIRSIAEHCRRINQADMTRPIILNSNGTLMDGGHRVARALLDGTTHLPAVRFAEMPPADWFEEIAPAKR